MSYYERCKECIGRPVCIRMTDGMLHRGFIDSVDKSYVYLRPLGGCRLGGFGYGFGGGFYGGYGYPYGGYGYRRPIWPLALAGIAALSLLYFW